MPTKTNPIPKEIMEYFECAMLHEKTPVMTENGIEYVCLKCKSALQGQNEKK